MIEAVIEAAKNISMWEIYAVIFALGYLVLAIRQNIWCWVCGFISTSIYLVLFWRVSLLSESLLQIFYLVLSVYGWYQWLGGRAHIEKKIIIWPLKKHVIVILLTGLIALIVGYLMDVYTGAKSPYLDAATSCFAIVTTYMVTLKVLENWVYWIVIDTASLYLYSSRQLYLTVLLFVLYIILSFLGYRVWKRSWSDEHQSHN